MIHISLAVLQLFQIRFDRFQRLVDLLNLSILSGDQASQHIHIGLHALYQSDGRAQSGVRGASHIVAAHLLQQSIRKDRQILQRFRDHVHTAAHHISHNVNRIDAGIDHGLHTDHGISTILQHIIHIREHILAGLHDHLRGGHNTLEGLYHNHIILQLCLHGIQRFFHTGLPAGIHHRKGISRFHHRFCHSTDKGGIYLFLHSIFRFARDFGGNTILFLIFIVVNGGMIHFTVDKSQHFLSKSLRNNQCRIVITVLHAFQCFLRGQSLQHTVSHVQRQPHDLRPGIIGSHGYFQLTGSCGLVRIPVGENVEPGIQCREDAESHDNNDRHHIIADPADVGGKYFPDIIHTIHHPPSLRSRLRFPLRFHLPDPLRSRSRPGNSGLHQSVSGSPG